MISSAVWIVEGSILYAPIMILRPGFDQERYLAGGHSEALTDGTKWKCVQLIKSAGMIKLVLASVSLLPTPATTPWPWRRSDRTSRARDLDLHRTLSGLSDG